MSQIGKFILSNDKLEVVLESIDWILKFASHCNGKFFGGYVRDVIVPRMKDPKCNVSFKDVDIWFTNDKDADNFVVLMKDTFNLKHGCFPRENNSTEYKFKRTQYYVLNNICNFNIDVVVSEYFPVDDFNVNLLTYYIVDGAKKLKAMDCNTKDFLIECIHKKEAHILDSYVKKLNSGDYRSSPHINRVNERYIAKGWTIIYDGIKIKQVMSLSLNHTVSLTKKEFKQLTEKKLNNQLQERMLLDKFTEMDNILQEAIRNRNKAFYDCIVNFNIIDKNFICDNLIQHPGNNTINELISRKI
jgi:hypothetical protein